MIPRCPEMAIVVAVVFVVVVVIIAVVVAAVARDGSKMFSVVALVVRAGGLVAQSGLCFASFCFAFICDVSSRLASICLLGLAFLIFV